MSYDIISRNSTSLYFVFCLIFYLFILDYLFGIILMNSKHKFFNCIYLFILDILLNRKDDRTMWENGSYIEPNPESTDLETLV
jgi:hypothetical protein